MKAILILGAAVWADGPSPAMRRRCAQAKLVWDKDKSQILVPCGGLGRYAPSEADAMRVILAKAGVPSRQIICEDRSTTTYENIRNAAEILNAKQVEHVTIVTDSYHVPRAWMVGRYFGLRAKMAGASTRGGHVPTQLKQHLREAGAIPLYAVKLLGHAVSGKDR